MMQKHSSLRRLFLSLAFALLSALGLAAQQPADAILGTLVWTRRGDILDSKNPDKAEAQKKLVGKVILHDLQHDEDADYKGGKIYDPESGKTYSCKATRQADGNLKVRGFIGASLFGRTTLWTRQR